MSKDILNPVNTTNSSSPAIKHAAEEPKNWRGQGETSVEKAISDDPRKNPVCPQVIKH